MREIITFLRSALPVTHVEVMMKDRKEGGANVKATDEGVTGEVGGIFELNRSLQMVCKYQNPILVPLDPERPLLWVERFNVIHDAVRGATGGSLQFEENVDMGFGVTGDLAKLVGIGANWESAKTLLVNV